MAFSSTAAAASTAFVSGHRRRGGACHLLSSSFLIAFPRAVAARRCGEAAAAPRRVGAVTVRAQAAAGAGKKSVLIVNTNGGGHAVIGFYLAKDLLAAGHAVTVLTVGDEGSDKMKKPPFSRFSVGNIMGVRGLTAAMVNEWMQLIMQELTSAGATTVWGDPADVGAAVGGGASFDVVLDNNGKDLDAVKYVASLDYSPPSLRASRRPDQGVRRVPAGRWWTGRRRPAWGNSSAAPASTRPATSRRTSRG